MNTLTPKRKAQKKAYREKLNHENTCACGNAIHRYSVMCRTCAGRLGGKIRWHKGREPY